MPLQNYYFTYGFWMSKAKLLEILGYDMDDEDSWDCFNEEHGEQHAVLRFSINGREFVARQGYHDDDLNAEREPDTTFIVGLDMMSVNRQYCTITQTESYRLPKKERDDFLDWFVEAKPEFFGYVREFRSKYGEFQLFETRDGCENC